MLALPVYLVTALVLLALAHRFVRPLERWAAIVLVALPLVVTGRAMFTDGVIAPVDLVYEHPPMNWMKDDYGMVRSTTGLHSDVYLQFIPWRKAAQQSLANGEWGVWNPFTYAGEPLLAGEQTALAWPITWIALLLPTIVSFNFTAAITMFVAALCAFLFARELECSAGTALVAAAAWSLATSIVLFLLVAMSQVWAWFPLVLLGVSRVVRRKEMGILAVALTALLANGHPESALFAVLFGIAWGIVELARFPSLKSVGLALAAGVLALLLAAVHLLPFLEVLPHSKEHILRETYFRYAPRGAPDEHVVARMTTVFFPWLAGRQLHLRTDAPMMHVTGAAGSVVLALAVYALVRRRGREVWFFAGCFVFAVVTGCNWTPVARLLGTVPIFDIALSDRMITGAGFCLSILAALGAEELRRRGSDRAAVLVACGVLVAIAAGNAALLRCSWVDPGEAFFGRHVIAAEIAGSALLVAVLMAKKPKAAMLVALIVAQRGLSVHDIYHTFSREQAYPPIPMLEKLPVAGEPFRITGHGLAFPPGTSTLYGLEDVRGYSPLTLNRYAETFPMWSVEQPVWFLRTDDLNAPFLDFLNVRYAVTSDSVPVPEGWRQVSSQEHARVLENLGVIERAFVPRRVQYVRSRDIPISMRMATDFRDRAWIEADADREQPNGPGIVRNLRRAKLGLEMEAVMQGEGEVVVSEAAWPGWRATVDGREVPLRIANHAFLALRVPAGTHHIRLTCLPRSVVLGASVTAATLAGLLLALGFRMVAGARRTVSRH